jgi:hypothetical protein
VSIDLGWGSRLAMALITLLIAGGSAASDIEDELGAWYMTFFGKQ